MVSTDGTRDFQGRNANYKTTRRGLVAAAAVFAAAIVSTRKAHPWRVPRGTALPAVAAAAIVFCAARMS